MWWHHTTYTEARLPLKFISDQSQNILFLKECLKNSERMWKNPCSNKGDIIINVRTGNPICWTRVTHEQAVFLRDQRGLSNLSLGSSHCIFASYVSPSVPWQPHLPASSCPASNNPRKVIKTPCQMRAGPVWWPQRWGGVCVCVCLDLVPRQTLSPVLAITWDKRRMQNGKCIKVEDFMPLAATVSPGTLPSLTRNVKWRCYLLARKGFNRVHLLERAKYCGKLLVNVYVPKEMWCSHFVGIGRHEFNQSLMALYAVTSSLH